MEEREIFATHSPQLPSAGQARTRAHPAPITQIMDHGRTSQGSAGEGKRGKRARVADRLGSRGGPWMEIWK
jgi:hypothetical protein